MSNESAAPAVGPRAIVAGHGDFAVGLISAVEQISGRGRMLLPLAIKQLGVEDIEALLRKEMVATGVRVIFTDLQAGSCTMALRRILHGMEDAVLIAGVNLPTLLDFVFADSMPPVLAARHAAERGKASIVAIGGAPK
jgi:PTS system N-acetylgalactosamine-specific IIA component